LEIPSFYQKFSGVQLQNISFIPAIPLTLAEVWPEQDFSVWPFWSGCFVLSRFGLGRFGLAVWVYKIKRMLPTIAMYICSYSFMYLCVPCYYDACLKSSALRVRLKTLHNTY